MADRTDQTDGKFMRRNITLPKSAVERLKQLRSRTEAVSDSQVIRDALKVYADYIQNAAETESDPVD